MVWRWPSVHLGQLAPTILPQCRLVSNPRCAGLSLSVAFRSVGFSLSLCVSRPFFLSLCVSHPLSLSQCLALLTLPRGFLFLLTLSRGCFFLFTLPTLSLCPSLPTVSASSYPLPACWLLSGISPFAWRRAQRRVEEPHIVPRYWVGLPEERFLRQPYEISSACQPHMQAVSISAHRGRHRSVALGSGGLPPIGTDANCQHSWVATEFTCLSEPESSGSS